MKLKRRVKNLRKYHLNFVNNSMRIKFTIFKSLFSIVILGNKKSSKKIILLKIEVLQNSV